MSDSAPRLTIRLLGAPEIRVAGLPLVLNHLKARALPFYLAATGQSHTRDLLTTLLWSESPPAGARHSLRSGIYRLRRLPLRLAQLREGTPSNRRAVGLLVKHPQQLIRRTALCRDAA